MRESQAQIIREYQISSQTNAAASTAKLLSLPDAKGPVRVIIEAKGDRIVFKFGSDSSVAASNAVASSKLADGNFTVADGAILSLDINNPSQAYVSCMNIAAASGATAYIRVCAVIR